MSNRYLPFGMITAALLFSGAAQAATTPLTAEQMLKQFNVVVSGDLTSTSHVDGRTYVGGSVSGGDYVAHASSTPASAYAGLTVGGSVSGSVKVGDFGAVTGGNVSGLNVNNGSSYIGGSATSSSFKDAWITGAAINDNLNGQAHAASYTNTNNNNVLSAPTAIMNSTLSASTSTNFGTVMTGLSSQLSAMSATAGTSVAFSNNNSNVTLTGSGSLSNGVVVFDLTSLDTRIFSATTTDISFNLTGATTVILNTDDKTLSLAANFNQAQSLGSSLIWNFAGATDVSVGRTFGGQVLVANGTFSNTGGANVEGGVFAKALNQQGEVHLQTFSGSIPAVTSVPEPETYAMLLAGMGLLGFMTRRHKRA